MNEEQRKLCRDLIIFPVKGRKISKEEFLRRFPSAVSRKGGPPKWLRGFLPGSIPRLVFSAKQGALAVRWLQEAYQARNDDDLSCALIIGFSFGFAPEHRETLQRLIDEDWHQSHESAVSALVKIPSADNVDALFRATQWIPKYLEYDEFRALAVKAIWALGAIPGDAAQNKLEVLAQSENEILRTNAMKQLGRRNAAPVAPKAHE